MTTIRIPRDLLAALRGELASHTAHWVAARGPLSHLVRHDGRMTDGGCLTCALLTAADMWLNKAEEPHVAAAPDEMKTLQPGLYYLSGDAPNNRTIHMLGGIDGHGSNWAEHATPSDRRHIIAVMRYSSSSDGSATGWTSTSDFAVPINGRLWNVDGGLAPRSLDLGGACCATRVRNHSVLKPCIDEF